MKTLFVSRKKHEEEVRRLRRVIELGERECEKLGKDLIKSGSDKIDLNNELASTYIRLTSVAQKLNGTLKHNGKLKKDNDVLIKKATHLLRELERANVMSCQLLNILDKEYSNPHAQIEELRALARLIKPRENTVNMINKKENKWYE